MAALAVAEPLTAPLADDPLAPAIAAAFAREATANPAAAAYAARGYAPIWLAGDGAAAAALIAALEDAGSHALPPSRYPAASLRDAVARTDPEGRAAAELALAAAFLRYANDLGSGLVEPRRVARMIKRDAPRREPAALLRGAAEAGDMASHLAALAPTHPDYAVLRARYAELRAAADATAGVPRLPEGDTLRAGERSARVEALRARLAARGFAPAAPAADPRLFDADLIEAVRAFQRAAGLDADGAVGRLTRSALNRDQAAEAAQIAANIERIRWLNIDMGRRRIEVNQPEFTVTVHDGDTILFRERVVVGTVENQTPEFSDEMDHLVLNPSWHVPSSIAIGEILPKLQADPFYLQNRNMRLVRTDGAPAPDPLIHDFSQYSAGNFPYRIRQAPNDDNALGLVKFMFPNDYAIYLHDTPSKNLFNRETRAFSHGCVRVRNPLALAELLLAPQQADPKAFIDRVLASGRERYVNLDEHLPVHLLYRTVTVGEDGGLQFHPDVYGRDARLIEALRREGLDAPEA